MYSLFPALVSALFLGYGAYVVAEKGVNRITVSFLLLCVTTFFWQASWAVLFQVHDTAYVDPLIRFGYLFIIFLPTALYHFSIEISGTTRERRWVYVSYAIATVLAGFDLFSDLFVNGHYHYFFGYYPKAGVLHPLHVLQTAVLLLRSSYVIGKKLQPVHTHQRARLLLRLIGVLVYFLAATDYLSNYGLELYPIGVIFITLNLGLLTMALTRYEVTTSVAVASTMAHEIRTPLVSIRMLADGLAIHLPELHKGYQLAIEHGLMKANIRPVAVQVLADLSRNISHLITYSNTIIDMMLAYAQMERIDTSSFAWHSMRTCVNEALDAYPFEPQKREKVTLVVEKDFQFYGSPTLLTLVISHLLKNALYALRADLKGTIIIRLDTPNGKPTLTLTDTGCGIPANVLPYIFDPFFTNRPSSHNGLGLAFCRCVIEASNGHMDCYSAEGEYTSFVLIFEPPTHELEMVKALPQTMEQAPATSENVAPANGDDEALLAKLKMLTGKTVILAEDDATNRDMMLGYLEGLGMKVLEAEDGQQVLRHLERGAHVDLILIDMQMPILNGVQTATAIRSQSWDHQNVPILALTGHSDQASIKTAETAGMNDFLVKTGDMKALREKILTVLSSAGKR